MPFHVEDQDGLA